MRVRPKQPSRIRRSKRRDTFRSTAQLILEEAENLIAEHGVDGLRLGVISERLGVTGAALYEHYPGGRRQIIERVAMTAVEGLAGSFPDSGSEPREQLIIGIRGLVHYLSENPAYLRLLLRDFSMPKGLPELTRRIGPPGEAEKTGLLHPMHERLDRLLRFMHNAADGRHMSSQLFFNALLGAACFNIVHPPFGWPSSARKRIATLEEAMIDLALAYLEPISRAKTPSTTETSRRHVAPRTT